MNLDLLKKLTRLANNNPNDHEANSAARRVCKMLEEANFSLNDNSTERPNFRHVSTPRSASYDWFSEMFKGYDRDREQYKSNIHGTWNWYEPKEPPKNEYKPPNYKPYTTEEQTKPKKEKRTLECKTCKKKVETVFAGLPDVFECNNCQWTAYTRGKVK